MERRPQANRRPAQARCGPSQSIPTSRSNACRFSISIDGRIRSPWPRPQPRGAVLGGEAPTRAPPFPGKFGTPFTSKRADFSDWVCKKFFGEIFQERPCPPRRGHLFGWRVIHRAPSVFKTFPRRRFAESKFPPIFSVDGSLAKNPQNH
jgi:hypothetical protein